MKRNVGLLFVVCFALIAIADLLHPGFAVTHDGQDHIARIANFYLNLSQGILIPRWAPNLNWGYGHPILEFLYPLPSYAASLLHFVGFSFVDATKGVYAFAMIASGLAMYFFIKTLWGDTAGVVSGVLYMYAPYRFVDLYIRGDIGEHVAFVFVPLIFLSLYLLAQKTTTIRFLAVSASLACLILSHNAVALMFVPLIILYTLFLWWQSKWQKGLLAYFVGSLSFGFLLSAFFWVPALFEGQYTLRNIVTKGEYVSRFVSFQQLLYGQWSYGQSGMFTVQLGVINWIMLVLGTYFAFSYRRKKKKIAVLLAASILYTIIAIFLMMSISQLVWRSSSLLQNFQFPWRFLAIPVFTTSCLGGFFVSQIKGIKQKITAFLLCVLILFLSKDYMHAKSYQVKPESFFTGIYQSTTDTGESSPIWSIRFMLHGFGTPMETIAGIASITQEKRLAIQHAYIVSTQGTARLLENTLYFPGWKVTVDGKSVPIQFQDPTYRGLMTFTVPDGTHEVIVSYQESRLRLLGDALTIAGVIGFCVFALTARRRKI